MSYFETLFAHEWELTTSPAGAQQWKPVGDAGRNVPDAHIPGKLHPPMMTTADLAMRMDPTYERISRDYMANPQKFAEAFARAWFKLTHRDMGPKLRYLGPLVPQEDFIWLGLLPKHQASAKAESATPSQNEKAVIRRRPRWARQTACHRRSPE